MKVAVAVAVALVVAAARASAAPTLPGGATIGFGALQIHEAGAPLAPPSSDDAAARYFNLAHCACAQPGAASAGYGETTYAMPMLLQNASVAVHRPLEVWVGGACDDPALRATQCHRIAAATIADLSTIPPGGAAPEVSIYDLMEPEPAATSCDARALAARQWALVDADGDGVYDYFAAQSIATDALAPPLPTDFAAGGGDGYLTITWTPPADLSDTFAYQALCARLDGTPVFASPTAAPRYVTARMLCGEALDVPLVPSRIAAPGLDTGVDASVDVAIPQGLAQLDPAYVCGDQADPTASSIRIDQLADGRRYLVMLLAIDRAGNAAATYFYPAVTTPSGIDWWEEAHRRGAGVEGGFCVVSETVHDDHGCVALVLAVVALRRRRRRG